jgi:hypothetical protein
MNFKIAESLSLCGSRHHEYANGLTVVDIVSIGVVPLR